MDNKESTIDILEGASPYSSEIEFYKKNNIPLWKGKAHDIIPLGRIWEDEYGNWIEATVKPMPAQFWDFTCYSKDSDQTTTFYTGSGGLSNYFGTAKLIATDMIVIDTTK